MNADDTTPPNLPEDTGPESGPRFQRARPVRPAARGGERRRSSSHYEQAYVNNIASHLGEDPCMPINWRRLPPDDLEHELLELNAWVNWLRHEYGLPAQIVPPMWHRHPDVLWELWACASTGCSASTRKPKVTRPWPGTTTSPRPASDSETGSRCARHRPRPRPPHTRDRLAWQRSRGLGRARNRRTFQSPDARRTSCGSSKTGCSTTYGAKTHPFARSPTSTGATGHDREGGRSAGIAALEQPRGRDLSEGLGVDAVAMACRPEEALSSFGWSVTRSTPRRGRRMAEFLEQR